jgi:hypothetical protein
MRNNLRQNDGADVPLLERFDDQYANDNDEQLSERSRDSTSDTLYEDQDSLESGTLLSYASVTTSEADESDVASTIHELEAPPRYESSTPPAYSRTAPAFTLKHIPSSNNDASRRAFEEEARRPAEFDVEHQADKAPNPCWKKRKPFPIVWGRIFIMTGLFLFGWFLGRSIVNRMLHRKSQCQVEYPGFKDYQLQAADHFEFNNVNQDGNGLPADFSGTLRFSTGPIDQVADIDVSIKSAADWKPAILSACAEAVVNFRPGLELANLHIKSDKLNVVLSTDVLITEKTIISLKEGSIVADRFDNSRETYIDLQKGKISGTFGLREVLSIKQKKKSSSFAVKPMPAFNNRSKPAVLNVEKGSGSLTIDYQGDGSDIPDREYRSSISSESGTLSGTILHGKETKIALKSGNVNVQILPVSAGASKLTTTMESGASTIQVLDPIGRGTIDKMSSSHKSKSGNLRLIYPEEWSGKIRGEAKSGFLELGGDNVVIMEDGSKGGKHAVQGRKGQGGSDLWFSIDSGGVDVTVGEKVD